MSKKFVFEDDPEWGPRAARFNLKIARMALERMPQTPTREQQQEWYLYYGAFLTFLWAAMQALKHYDGKRDRALGKSQDDYFDAHIKGAVEWEMIRQERHIVGHALEGGAYHPELGEDVIARHGGDWKEVVFDDFPRKWPDGPYKGRPFRDVADRLQRKVSDWIDAVETEDLRAKSASENVS